MRSVSPAVTHSLPVQLREPAPIGTCGMREPQVCVPRSFLITRLFAPSFTTTRGCEAQAVLFAVVARSRE